VAGTARRDHDPCQRLRRTVAIEDHTNDLTRILLVEDHASLRQALAFMFEREPEFEVVAQAGSFAEARTLPGEALKEVEVAVVDLALPDGDGFELIEHFSSAEPKIMTLVLSASLEPERFARAVEAGAAGVLHKAAPIKDSRRGATTQVRRGAALAERDPRDAACSQPRAPAEKRRAAGHWEAHTPR
jgi:DNA-binding NarL/FixJ family response regulator